MVNATTLARVKAHMDDTGIANEALYTSLIDAVSREIEAFIGYPLASAERTEYHRLGNNEQLIFLRVAPVSSIASVKVRPSLWDFASIDALVADTDYRLGENGVIYLNVETREGFDKAEVVYTAGLGATDGAVVTAAPDLALAADIQVGEEWRRRHQPATITIPGPSGSKQLASPHGFLPRVVQLLSPYQRVMIL